MVSIQAVRDKAKDCISMQIARTLAVVKKNSNSGEYVGTAAVCEMQERTDKPPIALRVVHGWFHIIKELKFGVHR